MERKRLYRASINGKVSVEEAAKLSYMISGIRADLEADKPVIDGGVVYSNPINIVSVPCGGQHDTETGRIIYADGTLVEQVPYAPFVATPDFPATEPQARIEQLEQRVALLEARNAYLELPAGARAAPGLRCQAAGRSW